MTDNRTPDEIELDLMAYVDGLLEDDPERKAMVEARLMAAETEAERVAAYREQNAALRRYFGRVTEEPVPERLYAALHADRSGDRARVGKIASVCLLTATAALSGWWLGRSDPPAPWPSEQILETGLIGAMNDNASSRLIAEAGAAAPMNWLSERISISLRLPELGSRGYTLTGKETVHIGEDRLVRLTYGQPDGKGFNLLLRPWWRSRNPEIKLMRRDDLWIAYWRDGPVASVLAARLSRDEVKELAREVRREMHNRNHATPKVRAAPPTLDSPGLAAGAAGNEIRPAGEPVEPIGIRPQSPAGVPVRTN